MCILNLLILDIEKSMIKIELMKPWINYEKKVKKISLFELGILSLQFIRYSKKTKDYRFLNAALKINDLLIVNKNELKIKLLIQKIKEEEEKLLKEIKNNYENNIFE